MDKVLVYPPYQDIRDSDSRTSFRDSDRRTSFRDIRIVELRFVIRIVLRFVIRIIEVKGYMLIDAKALAGHVPASGITPHSP